jgi:hypothetical protein
VGTLADRVRRAAEALERRVGDAPATLDGAATSEPALAQAIGALVAPEGPFPVFGRLPASAFDGLVGEPATGAGSAGAGAARLDPDWLETVAAVRPAVARLEAVQLAERVAGAGHAPLRAWSNRPGDPWQTVASPPSDVEVVRPSRLVAAFGPVSALPDQPTAATAGTVAASVIDRFAETVPDTEHVAALAFPHDAPTARAPQAVLLAVPPVVDEELSPDVLVDVISEVRALARARMVDPAGLGADATGSLHYAALPASGRTGVDLGAR